jgi:phosphoglycerate kinase
VIENLLPRSTRCWSAGLAYTFLRAQGIAVGSSRVEADKVGEAEQRSHRRRPAASAFCRSITDRPARGRAEARTTTDADPRRSRLGVDIGPRTRAAYAAEVAKARTV